MKTIISALLLATLLTACDLESDPTKDKKINHKNTVHSLQKSQIEQKGINHCLKNLNVRIQDTYVFEPNQDFSESFVAEGLGDLKIDLAISNNPDQINIVYDEDKKEYAFSLDDDTNLYSEDRNFTAFTVNLEIIPNSNISKDILNGCELSKEVKIYLIKPNT